MQDGQAELRRIWKGHDLTKDQSKKRKERYRELGWKIRIGLPYGKPLSLKLARV